MEILPKRSRTINSLEFIFRDDCLFALNKCHSIHSTKLKDGGHASVADLLLREWPELKSVGDTEGDAGLINRLDAATSGVLIGAFQREIWLSLRSQQSSGAIEKSYFALVEGRLEGIHKVDGYIASRSRKAKRVKVFMDKPKRGYRGLPAYSTISYAGSFKEHTLVRVKIERGRRHQIRAHCAFIGHPLIGDELYGATSRLDQFLEHDSQLLPSFFLHASRVVLQHPVSKDSMEISAAWPNYAKALKGVSE
ncbi:MAG: RNA pseudouridine synthase [Bdellovibrionales bacterium]|nr:RNA pseudouridine synthase [Bdellovibrionales bacterium]